MEHVLSLLRSVDSTSINVAKPSLIPDANKRTGACATISESTITVSGF